MDDVYYLCLAVCDPKGSSSPWEEEEEGEEEEEEEEGVALARTKAVCCAGCRDGKNYYQF